MILGITVPTNISIAEEYMVIPKAVAGVGINDKATILSAIITAVTEIIKLLNTFIKLNQGNIKDLHARHRREDGIMYIQYIRMEAYG